MKSEIVVFVRRYGAYGVGFLGALGALLAALFMPDSATSLISSAGLIALATFYLTDENDPFVLRLLAMLAAGVVTVFAYLMPQHASELLETAGVIVLIGLWLA